MRRLIGTGHPGRIGLMGAALAAMMPVLAALVLACTAPQMNFYDEISLADRSREWGLIYFQSWRKERNREYLVLARQRTQEAVSAYLDVQRRMGYSYPGFYKVDRRRVESCIFLKQMQVEAVSFAVKLDETGRVGCFD